jgi:hypothetical protein
MSVVITDIIFEGKAQVVFLKRRQMRSEKFMLDEMCLFFRLSTENIFKYHSMATTFLPFPSRSVSSLLLVKSED